MESGTVWCGVEVQLKLSLPWGRRWGGRGLQPQETFPPQSAFASPAGVPGLPSISCRASNYENFSCFWASSVETFLPTRYITTYR